MHKKYSFIIVLSFVSLCINHTQAQSLKDKIGQMIWNAFNGTKLNDTIRVDLKNRNMGGVILYSSYGNLSNPAQIKQLTDTIKNVSKTAPFISVDQEGGRVARLSKSNGFADSYTAYTLGTVINREDSTRKSTSTMASWLKQCGFNVNLAPVADVNVNPTSPAIGTLQRSYSQQPSVVFNHTKWFIDEFEKKNILTCLKHFPGHGSAMQDSHLGFTDITLTWADSELIPYQLLIANGYNDFIMIGHLYNSFLDPVYPGTLSKKIVTDLLRTQLGFSGLIITDAMLMQAITNNYGFDEAVVLAVNAGNDILLYNSTLRNNSSLFKQVTNIIEQKVNEGKIPVYRINESYNRIIQYKKKYGIITDVEQYADQSLPSGFELYQNYPNPFNPSTIISWQIAVSSYVTLKVYDLLGREIATLVDEFKPVGIYHSTFNTQHSKLSSGVYYYTLQIGGNTKTKKMILMK